MNTMFFFIVTAVSVTLQFLSIYLAYLLVSRRYVSQKQILHVSFVVTGYCMLAGILAGFVGISSSVGIPITALIIYHMGRRQLQQTKKQAWTSIGIFLGISVLLVMFFFRLMVTDESFCNMILQIMV